jgi:hypothetical protein
MKPSWAREETEKGQRLEISRSTYTCSTLIMIDFPVVPWREGKLLESVSRNIMWVFRSHATSLNPIIN